jgi:transposase
MSRAVSVYKKKNIVYVDESGIDRHLHRRNAGSAKGKKVIGCSLIYLPSYSPDLNPIEKF